MLIPECTVKWSTVCLISIESKPAPAYTMVYAPEYTLNWRTVWLINKYIIFPIYGTLHLQRSNVIHTAPLHENTIFTQMQLNFLPSPQCLTPNWAAF